MPITFLYMFSVQAQGYVRDFHRIHEEENVRSPGSPWGCLKGLCPNHPPDTCDLMSILDRRLDFSGWRNGAEIPA